MVANERPNKRMVGVFFLGAIGGAFMALFVALIAGGDFRLGVSNEELNEIVSSHVVRHQTRLEERILDLEERKENLEIRVFTLECGGRAHCKDRYKKEGVSK